jgi:hypothetical protein
LLLSGCQHGFIIVSSHLSEQPHFAPYYYLPSIAFIPASSTLYRILALKAATALVTNLQFSLNTLSNNHSINGIAMTCLWGLILRSFDLLLLRRVYVLTAACIQSPHPGRQAENEAAKHQKKSDAPLLPRFSRFLLALQLLFNVRDLSTPYAITHVAPFSQFNPSYTPSRLAFLLHHFLSFVSGYFILNILSLLPSPDPNIGIPIAQQAFFSRLQEVTLIEAFGRVSSSVIYWCAVALFIGTMHDLVGLVLVGLRISPPDLFPPIFASLSTGYSLRQFWGYASIHFPTFMLIR